VIARKPESTEKRGVNEQTASPRKAAMTLLAVREHSRQELLRKLQARFESDELEDALLRLSDEQLQSDRRFAQGYARERALKGHGPQRIQAELLKRGISGNDADSALQALKVEEGIEWITLARQVLRKKYGSPQLPAEYPERARRLRFLQYRGFAADQLSSLDEADFSDPALLQT
jgi:regulatory protein